MQVGVPYFVRVFVRNAAGLEGSLDSPPITVAAPADGMSPGVVVAIVCACMVGAAAVAGVTAYWLSRTRYASAPLRSAEACRCMWFPCVEELPRLRCSSSCQTHFTAVPVPCWSGSK